MTVQDDIKNIVEQHDGVLFMKGIKTQPQCGFSNALVNVLDSLQVELSDKSLHSLSHANSNGSFNNNSFLV